MGLRGFFVFFMLLASLCSLVFFLLLTDPRYLSVSGFLAFYASAFGAVWSMIIVGWYFAFMRRGRGGSSSTRAALARHASLAALCIVVALFLSQMRSLSWYTIVPLAALAAFAEYTMLFGRKR